MKNNIKAVMLYLNYKIFLTIHMKVGFLKSLSHCLRALTSYVLKSSFTFSVGQYFLSILR